MIGESIALLGEGRHSRHADQLRAVEEYFVSISPVHNALGLRRERGFHCSDGGGRCLDEGIIGNKTIDKYEPEQYRQGQIPRDTMCWGTEVLPLTEEMMSWVNQEGVRISICFWIRASCKNKVTKQRSVSKLFKE